MNTLEQRLTKLEDAAERRLDISGRLAATEAQRVVLRKLSSVPGAAEIVRESVELTLKGMARDAPEMQVLQRRLQDAWRRSGWR